MSFESLESYFVASTRRYLAGVGHLMMAGAIALSLMLFAERGNMGVIPIAVCVLAGLVSGYQGLAALREFVLVSSNRTNAALVSLATGFFALLAGGLLGVVAVSIIGKAIASA